MDENDPVYIANHRKEMIALELADLETVGPCPPDLTQSTLDVPLRDGFLSHTILIRPAPSPAGPSQPKKKKCPLIIYFHGGSFTYLSPNHITSPGRGFASYYGAIVASPSYKLIPENPWPAPVQSAWEVVAWLTDPKNLNDGPLKDEAVEFDPSLGFILAGASAGGHIAAVIAGVAAVARSGDKSLISGLPDLPLPIDGLFLTIPYLSEPEMIPARHRAAYRSRQDNPPDPIVTVEHLKKMVERHKPDIHSPWFSPINLDLAGIRQHHPSKVYVQCGAKDPIRDDAVTYEKVVREANAAETKIDVLEGIGHGTWVSLPMPTAHSQVVKETNMDGMGWLLGMEWDRTKPLPY